ncbi:hypothetical protein BV25DRAFT_1817814 [Artomyces pyxidatus]|uniref:Uncharacterized protein n=1 Tax=Artomyces pyxidatus TaxID=48021 RepID=A0ACB8TKB8_9AGAM|nr:hypothetical protein BV25DRAFT_1817814 [Artomyces pyxidatus]
METLSPVDALPQRTRASNSTISPETRLAVFSAIIFPAAIIPLLVVRRSLSSMHLKIDQIGATTSTLRRECKLSLSELAVQKEERAQLRHSLSETQRSLNSLRESLQRLQASHDVTQHRTNTQAEELMKSRSVAQAQLSHWRNLGSSLADIAAFMQEIELKQGFITQKHDGRGIERLRRLALQLENLSEDAKETTHQARFRRPSK